MSTTLKVKKGAVLIADGLIATTQILKRLLDESYGSTQVVLPEQIPSVAFGGRQVFISRMCHPRYRWLPRYLAQSGIPYVYYLDDNFHELTTEYDPVNGSFFSHPAVHSSLDEILRYATSVWVMSKVLGDYLKKRMPALTVNLTRAPVDTELFDKAYLTAKSELTPSSNRDEIFRVGYPTTRRVNISPLVSEIARRSLVHYGNSVRFEFVGWCPPEIADLPNVSLAPQIDGYEKFVMFMLTRGWHCAIAPLGDSLFENSKTNLKYREYAAARLPGVYSDCALYRTCVEDGTTGLLCSNDPSEWLTNIDKLKIRESLREQIVENAYADVHANYAQFKVAASVRRAFSANEEVTLSAA
jgi:glycosyltransferase involved in cell wall biosynthesis